MGTQQSFTDDDIVLFENGEWCYGSEFKYQNDGSESYKVVTSGTPAYEAFLVSTGEACWTCEHLNQCSVNSCKFKGITVVAA